MQKEAGSCRNTGLDVLEPILNAKDVGAAEDDVDRIRGRFNTSISENIKGTIIHSQNT
jgi:hypothetical protein